MKSVLKVLLVTMLLFVFIVAIIACLSGCRETKVRVSHGSRHNATARFRD